MAQAHKSLSHTRLPRKTFKTNCEHAQPPNNTCHSIITIIIIIISQAELPAHAKFNPLRYMHRRRRPFNRSQLFIHFILLSLLLLTLALWSEVNLFYSPTGYHCHLPYLMIFRANSLNTLTTLSASRHSPPVHLRRVILRTGRRYFFFVSIGLAKYDVCTL